DAEDLEQTLHAAVLSPWAVEHREGDVAIQQPSGRREAHRGALGAPAPLTVDGHLNRLVTRLPEAGGDRYGRAQRHLVLARRPATDHRDPHGVTVDGGLVPTAIVTVSPRCPREPDGGNSEITKPIWLGSVVVCSVTAGTKPAFFRADTAAFRVWPTTSGT